MAGIIVSKLVREHHPIDMADSGGRTVGQLVDTLITDMLHGPEELHKIELLLEPEDWYQLRGSLPPESLNGSPARKATKAVRL